MRDKGLDEELSQDTLDVLDLLGLAGSGGDPLLGLGPGLVESEQTALASSLDQLVWLCNKLGTLDEQPRVGGLGLVENILDGLVCGEVQRGELGWRVVCGRGGQRSGLDDGSASEVVVEDGLAVGLEDGLGGHD